MKSNIIIGEIFHDLTVIHKLPKSRVTCRCICGKIKDYRHNHIKYGKIKSCGCLSKRQAGPNTSHGLTDTREYSIWCDMKKRCYNPNTQNYKWYGGSGIKVCDRWINSFENFIEDMGACPTKTSSIERSNNSKDYCKDNCLWIDISEQYFNRSSTIKVKHNNKIMSLKDYAEAININYKTLYNHYSKGDIKKYLKDKNIEWKEDEDDSKQ